MPTGRTFFRLAAALRVGAMKLEGNTVAVLGAGTMGQGIAQIAAVAGFDTRIFDAKSGVAESAVASIATQLEKLVGKGKITSDAKDKALARMSPATSIEK